VRVGVISDVHANLPALEAVIAAIGVVDALWCLGDVVGYVAEPNECIARLRELEAVCIVGNHDLAALGQVSLETFNADAAAAARWTTAALTPTSRQWLAERAPATAAGPVLLAHGSPYDPVWEYVTSGRVAARSLTCFDGPLCLVGHTHVPSSFVQQPDGRIETEYRVEGDVVSLGETRLLANPGSVGQPRDEDPRAAYLILDSEAATLTWYRTPYPVALAQEKILAARLPERLARRLVVGL
jgi:diadenosine tetraphosphatase ApaH/serine/threonine PP2A family protein phosphatase